MNDRPDIRGVGMTSQRTRDRLVSRLRARGIINEMLLDVLAQTPRHLFIDEALAHRAYEDTSLPIGFGQTISQPYTVARMTEILISDGMPERVLEIGTGSGYQTAVLAQLIDKVYTVERLQGLLDRARETLRLIDLRNIQFKYDDGNMGWSERGPFDAIIVTASARHVPPELVGQLADNGRLLLPVGTADSQKLMLVDSAGAATEVEDVRFVPLLGGKN